MRSRQQKHRAEWGPAYIESGYVFTQENGEPLNPELVTKRFAREVEASGLPEVELTIGEVKHAHDFQPTDLFVVGGIEWERTKRA